MILKIELNTHFIMLINSKALSHFLGFMVVYFLPPLIVNYVLFFSKNQWERVRKDYKHYDGKVYKMYYILSIVLPVSFLIFLKLAHDLFGFIV